MKQNIILIIGLVLCGVTCVYGLGQRDAVIKIRAIAANMELSPAQVENVTQTRAKNYIQNNYPATTAEKLKELKRYWPGIKIMLSRDAVERQTQTRIVLFKQLLLAAYPNAVGFDTQYAKDIARQLLPLLYGEVDPNDL